MIRLHSFPTSPFYTVSAPPQHAGADVPADAHHKRNCASEIFPIHFDLIVFKIHTLSGMYLQAVEKVEHSWAFSHLYGKISMGDERCLNEGSWIVES